MRNLRERERKLRRRNGRRKTGLWISATLRLFRKMDCIAQEMEREEGEGVQGRVRPEGEEEGGQGHQEQDDGQGVEVPELQVGTNKDVCLQIHIFQGQPRC